MRRDAWLAFLIGLVVTWSPMSLADQEAGIQRFLMVEETDWIDPLTTRLSLYSGVAGELVLLDAEFNEIQREQGSPVFLVHVWQMENADELPDQLFFVRFIPEQAPPFQRLLRVTPGEDVRRSLTRAQRQWFWEPVEQLPVLVQTALPEAAESAAEVWMSLSALDQELDEFIGQLNAAGVEMPDETDFAEALKQEGFALMGEGLYAEALLLLQQSFAIHAAEDLQDRIERLELYLDLQARIEP